MSGISSDALWVGLTALLYAVALYNCARILRSRLSAGGAIAWILCNLLMPIIGVPLYFLLGQNRLTGYVRRHKKSAAEVVVPRSIGKTQPDYSFLERESTQLDTLKRFDQLFSNCGSVFEAKAGTVQLLEDGHSTFDAIFEAISQAKHYILVQYYILRSDRLGIELKNLLIDRVKAGLPVYLLYDNMGSFWLSQTYLRDLRQAGVKVETFLPVKSYKRFFQLNFRNHRKLVVVDGEVAFSGGLNVGEEYATKRYKASKRKQQYWRDTHLKATGEPVGKYVETFLQDWNFASEAQINIDNLTRQPSSKDQANPTRQADKSKEYFVKRVKEAEQKSRQPDRPSSSKIATWTSTDDIFEQRECHAAVQVIPTGPADTRLISIFLLAELIANARQRLWLTTPYLVPDDTLLQLLELATLRGVDVRILISKKADYRFMQWVTLSYAEQLTQKGIKVYLYEIGMMHQKVILVDEAMATIGTLNLDNRALYLNFETTTLIHNRQFAKETAQMLERDFANSSLYECSTKRPSRGSIGGKIGTYRAGLARLLAPML